MSGGFATPPGGGGGLPGPSPASLPTSTVELSVKANDLSDLDVLSKSDPVCVLFKQPKGMAGRWVEVGRTERVKDTVNPEWQHKFVLEYSFEERQVIKFEIYDWDVKGAQLEEQDFLGRVETTLGQVVSGAGGRGFAAILRDAPSGKGRLTVVAEELQASKEVVTAQFAAKGLDKKDFFGKSDPFFVISKSTSSGQFVVVRKSEVIKNDLNPAWRQMVIPVRDLCNNDYERALRFDVYDWDSDGSHDLIGSFKTDLRTLTIAAMERKKFPCINEKKTSKKGYKNSGEMLVQSIAVTQETSFLDYIQSGTAMNFSVAVDFTASNGPPADPRSLHHFNPAMGENQYTTAIKAVGSIIEDYDTDKMFPALGFGARIPPSGQVSHEFFLNMRQDNPYCSGVQGLLQAYHTALQSVTLYGPTNFSPVINHVQRFAKTYQDGKQYFVLLIITDGIITDMDETINSIIQASGYPMSIIIVGVGNEDFSAMEALDSDGKLLARGGRIAARDMVQFVELRKFVGPGGVWDKELLAKEVLAEVPKQLISWMKTKGISPARNS